MVEDIVGVTAIVNCTSNEEQIGKEERLEKTVQDAKGDQIVNPEQCHEEQILVKPKIEERILDDLSFKQMRRSPKRLQDASAKEKRTEKGLCGSLGLA